MGCAILGHMLGQLVTHVHISCAHTWNSCSHVGIKLLAHMEKSLCARWQEFVRTLDNSKCSATFGISILNMVATRHKPTF